MDVDAFDLSSSDSLDNVTPAANFDIYDMMMMMMRWQSHATMMTQRWQSHAASLISMVMIWMRPPLASRPRPV